MLRAVGRWEGEIVQTTKAGKRINVAVRWALQKDNVGWPDAIIEIGRDVTADKVAARRSCARRATSPSRRHRPRANTSRA